MGGGAIQQQVSGRSVKNGRSVPDDGAAADGVAAATADARGPVAQTTDNRHAADSPTGNAGSKAT